MVSKTTISPMKTQTEMIERIKDRCDHRLANGLRNAEMQGRHSLSARARVLWRVRSTVVAFCDARGYLARPKQCAAPGAFYEAGGLVAETRSVTSSDLARLCGRFDVAPSRMPR